MPAAPGFLAGGKQAVYSRLRLGMLALLADERDWLANLANASAFLYEALPDLNWVGFYLSRGRGDELVLGPFQGRPACVRIAFGRGVCGTAARARESLLVPDVREFPDHILCDAASRSELVVPMIQAGGKLVGVLDMDSPTPDRFDEEDRSGCESLVAALLEASDFPAFN